MHRLWYRSPSSSTLGRPEGQPHRPHHAEAARAGGVTRITHESSALPRGRFMMDASSWKRTPALPQYLRTYVILFVPFVPSLALLAYCLYDSTCGQRVGTEDRGEARGGKTKSSTSPRPVAASSSGVAFRRFAAVWRPPMTTTFRGGSRDHTQRCGNVADSGGPALPSEPHRIPSCGGDPVKIQVGPRRMVAGG